MVEFFCAHDFTPESQDSIAYYVSSISISRPTFCSILRTQTQILSNSRHHDMCVGVGDMPDIVVYPVYLIGLTFSITCHCLP